MDCQKHLFSLPEDHHYLNGAYFSPLLKTVEQAGIEGIRQKREPWHTTTKDFFEGSETLKAAFARLVHADHANQIAILPSTSYGMSTIAKNLPPSAKGKKIVVMGEQYPSNIYAWQRYCQHSSCRIETVEAPSDFKNRGKKWNERILEAINKDTLMITMGNIHWADGTLFDLKAIGERAREMGAYFVVDGTQSVGALPFDIRQVKPDALFCAGYKWLMGPYSMALGYFGDKFSDGLPLEEGWIERKNSEDFAGLVRYTDAYQPGSIRYDVGERSNFILVPMMIKALEQVLDWEPAAIQAYCRQLTQNITGELLNLGYKIENPAWRAHHLFGIKLPNHVSPDKIKEKLTENNIHVSVRGSGLRIAPNVYNDEKDIQALLNVLSA